MITKNTSMMRSQYVLDLVLNTDGVQNDVDCFVECYQNGREQGFQLWNWRKAILWAEHRNSDQIVVYVGGYAMQSIDEDAYSHRNYFGTESEAAEFIVKTARELFPVVPQVVASLK